MATWITLLEGAGTARGLRVAVKDAIDVVGVPTTVGCRALADRGEPAAADAACLAGFRLPGVTIVGKSNLHELCYGTTGLNPVFGNPVNPRWPDLVPGGSSSGSAAAVASGEVEVALGTDTGGSVRLPAACCGIVGLKTTFGRVPLDGVWPLSPSLDTVGPLAADVPGVVKAMTLLDPAFSVDGVRAAGVVGRVRARHLTVDPGIDTAVDAALRAAGFDLVEVELDAWAEATRAFVAIIAAEAWAADKHLLGIPGGVAEPVASRLAQGADVSASDVERAKVRQAIWAAEVSRWLGRVDVLALPTLFERPSSVAHPSVPNDLCHPFNLAGTPAISVPVGDGPGESLQLVGPHNGEELLCATAAVVEAALA